MQADYGAEEVGMITGAMAKLKDAVNSGNFFGADLGSIAAQAGKAVSGVGSFATGGLMAGTGAAYNVEQVLHQQLQEMIFNGIDYRNFSFTFKFTLRSKEESDVVNSILHCIKDVMLPERYGDGSSIADTRWAHMNL